MVGQLRCPLNSADFMQCMSMCCIPSVSFVHYECVPYECAWVDFLWRWEGRTIKGGAHLPMAEALSELYIVLEVQKLRGILAGLATAVS
jgi:hypothetical protein